MRIIVNVIFILFVAALLIACKSTTDDYRSCTAIFSTDKEEYQSGDTIRLTLSIEAEKDQKAISVYDNFDNLEFSSSFTRTCYPENPEAGDCALQTMIQEKFIEKRESKYRTYQISPGKPYTHTFIGTVFFDAASTTYTITFPELGYQGSFKKTEFEISKSYGFSGYLNDIRPASGVSEPYLFVKYKSIKLKD